MAKTKLRVKKRAPQKRRQVAEWFVSRVRRRGAFALTPEAVIHTAERWTGLSEAVPGEVEEPLDLLCSDLAACPPTDVGGLMIATMLSQSLAGRYAVQHASLPPGSIPATPPIVIVGWYRTATTFLQSLLESLPGYHFAPMYLLMDPVPGPLSWVRAEIGVRVIGAFEPKLIQLHHVAASLPEEDWFIMNQHLIADALSQHWTVPNYAAWVRQVDRTAAYRQWARSLALIERVQGSGLVVKDPMHMLSIDTIAKTLPEARIIWTHRDPLECIPSYGSLCALQHRLMYGEYSSDWVGKVVLGAMDRYLRAGLAGRPAVAKNRLIDVKYGDLVRDPVGTVRAICQQADLPYCEETTQARLKRLKLERNGSEHAASLEQWGLTPGQVRARLNYYDDEFWQA